jgi:predicted nucleic acid-binding protein
VAIAASRGLPVITQDNDFEALGDVAGVTILRV